MKRRIVEAIKTGVISVIALVFMISVFFGAVLQESYKLCPVTPEEIAADVVIQGSK